MFTSNIVKAGREGIQGRRGAYAAFHGESGDRRNDTEQSDRLRHSVILGISDDNEEGVGVQEEAQHLPIDNGASSLLKSELYRVLIGSESRAIGQEFE